MVEKCNTVRAFDDPLFDDADLHANALLDSVYSHQTDVFLPFEMQAYYRSPRWLAARSVLDVGTGNGAYLAALARQFPDKGYLGIDIAIDQVRRAQVRTRSSSLTFQIQDLFDATGTFDGLVMRLVAQHLPDMSLALRKCAELTSVDGVLFIIDAFDQGTFYWPEPVALTRMYRLLGDERRAAGVDHDIAEHLDAVLATHPQWAITAQYDLAVPTSVPGFRARIHEMQMSIFAYLAHMKAVDMDFNEVRDAWQTWYSADFSYGQEGLRVFELHRIKDK